MSAPRLHASDEGRHLPGTDVAWGESWYHDFASSDGTYGGWLRIGLYPNLGVVWYWVAIVRAGQPLTLISDTTAPCPPRDPANPLLALEVRNNRYETAWTCTEPMMSWHIAGSGTARTYANPADVFTASNRGDGDVDCAFNLEWRAAAPVFPYTATTRYEQSSWVSGEVRIGDERIDVYCPGQRDHSWGNRVWSFPWLWTSGHLPKARWFHAVRTHLGLAEGFQTGYVVEPGRDIEAIEHVEVEYQLDADELLTAASVRIGSLSMSVVPELHAPVKIQSPDGVAARFPRALCRFETADGTVGRGWVEFNFPAGSQ